MCQSLPILSVFLLAIVALTYTADSPPVKGNDALLRAVTTTRKPATIFWTTTKRPPTTFRTTTKRPPTPFWTTTQRPSRPSSTTTHRPTTTAMPPVDCSSGKEFWPDHFCDKYIWCVFGEQQTRQCPSNLYWNTKLNVCDYPWDVPSSQCTPPIAVSATKEVTKETTGQAATPIAPPSSIGISKLNESWHMKDKKAYWPSYWQPFYIIKSAPLALPTTSAAVGETNSTTTSAATQQTDSTTPATVTSTSSEASTVKIEENLTSTNGQIRATTRPKPSISVTTKRPRRTTTTRKPRPPISATAPIDCNSDVEFWPHPECDKYIWCIDGEQLTQKCSKGLFWNYQLEKCDWPANVPKDHCTNPPPVVNSVVTTTSTTPVPPRDCSTDIEFYSHPDCDKFIRCADGEPQTFVCPGNLYWDNDNEQCEWPKKVQTSECIEPTKKNL